MFTSNYPYLGVAYYPESWPSEQMDEEIALMKKMGLNIVRIAEFSWSRLEPQESCYDFSWLENVLMKLRDAQISVIMCTPTATPPIWIYKNHSECIALTDMGAKLQHGSRRHFCPNSEKYRELCGKIIETTAQKVACYKNIVAWQIDNEINPSKVLGASDRGCFCRECVEKFQETLRNRFHSIENMNEAWGMCLWSMDYQDFSQIEPPRTDTWHSPSLLSSWMNFQAQSNIDYCDYQAKILKSCGVGRIGTDTIPSGGLSHHNINANLDVVMQNHYTHPDELWRATFWMNLSRPIKKRPFWITETSPCWNGAGTMGGGYREVGFCRVNTWLAYAFGAEANLYWLWRGHKSGHEMMHGSIISSSARPLHVATEVREIADGLEKCAGFLRDTRPVEPAVGLHFSQNAWWNFKFQPMVDGFDYFQSLTSDFYHPIFCSMVGCDIIDPVASLEKYRLLFSPFLPSLDEGGLKDRIIDWVESGGTWVVGPMSDIRTLDVTAYTSSPFGSLEEWLGAYCKFQIPGYPVNQPMEWSDGGQFNGSLWHDAFEPSDAVPMATYTSGPLKGLSGVVMRQFGKGRIIALGTVPEYSTFSKLFAMVCGMSNVKVAANASSNIIVVPRIGREQAGVFIIETERKSGWVELEGSFIDLLTSKACSGRIEVGPYQVMCLKTSMADFKSALCNVDVMPDNLSDETTPRRSVIHNNAVL